MMNRHRERSLWVPVVFGGFAGVLLLLATHPVPAVTIADSFDDWSPDGTQGENGWSYGYYNLTTDDNGTYEPGDFIPFLNDGSGFVDFDGVNHWDGSQYVLYRDTAATIGQETGPWTRVGQLHGHPNGTNSAAPPSVPDSAPEEHWVIRRWVSNYTGQVSAISSLSDANTGCGTGTTVHLFHNGTLLSTLTTSSAATSTTTAGPTLAVGDTLDLALTPEGTGGPNDRADPCDGSNFRLKITDDPPPPPPRTPIADSSNDWSTTGTQGEKNWHNGYYNLTQDADGVYQTADFIPFTNSAGPGGGPVDPDGNHWTGTQWDLTSAASGPWTELGRENTHPNGTNSIPNDEHWTIRRWVADRSGPLEVNWQMRKTNLSNDGVSGVVMVNGQVLDQATIAGNDGVGVNKSVYINARPGDIIELALTPQGVTNRGDGSDGSANQLTVFDELPDGPLYNPVLPPVIHADSVAEFSENQGQDGWSYGYYDQRVDVEERDGKYSTDDFIAFLNDGSGVVSDDPAFEGWKESTNHWDGNKWDLLANAAPVSHGPWTEVTSTGGHPAANAQGDEEVHWAIRRWVSDVEGPVRISGQINNTSASGDGTVGRIFLDGEEVHAEFTDGFNVNYNVDVEVKVGSILDFAIDSDGAGNFDPMDPLSLNSINDGSDSTRFTVLIQQLQRFIPGGGQPGDFDGDGDFDVDDVNQLNAAINTGKTGPPFDLTGDTAVDFNDLAHWVNEIKKTWLGDANLDGEFNSSDFVFVFQAGEYEDAIADNSQWQEGDWNGDQDFGTSDLVIAFQAGGFERGPRAAAEAVPEPAAAVLALIGLASLLHRRSIRL